MTRWLQLSRTSGGLGQQWHSCRAGTGQRAAQAASRNEDNARPSKPQQNNEEDVAQSTKSCSAVQPVLSPLPASPQA